MATIGYVRVSTERQTNEHWKMLLSDYAQQQGLQAPQWIEEQVSGAKPWKQRKLAPWLATATRGDVLLVGEASRIGRNATDAGDFLRAARAAGISVHVIQAGQVITPDGDNATADLIIGILFYVAQFERDLLKKRIKLGLERARAEGKQLGGYRGRATTRPGQSRQRHPDRDKILASVADGASISRVSARFGVSRRAIYNWLEEAQQKL